MGQRTYSTGWTQTTRWMTDADSSKWQTVLHTAMHTLMCLIMDAPPPFPSLVFAKIWVEMRWIRVCVCVFVYAPVFNHQACVQDDSQRQITVNICPQRPHLSFWQTGAQGAKLAANCMHARSCVCVCGCMCIFPEMGYWEEKSFLLLKSYFLTNTNELLNQLSSRWKMYFARETRE